MRRFVASTTILCASPLASQETENAKMAMASGTKMEASASDEIPAHDTQAIMTSPQIKHTVSRWRFSAGRSSRFATLDLRNNQTAKRMKVTNSTTAAA